jgi:hypothetical protein
VFQFDLSLEGGLYWSIHKNRDQSDIQNPYNNDPIKRPKDKKNKIKTKTETETEPSQKGTGLLMTI